MLKTTRKANAFLKGDEKLAQYGDDPQTLIKCLENIIKNHRYVLDVEHGQLYLRNDEHKILVPSFFNKQAYNDAFAETLDEDLMLLLSDVDLSQYWLYAFSLPHTPEYVRYFTEDLYGTVEIAPDKARKYTLTGEKYDLKSSKISFLPKLSEYDKMSNNGNGKTAPGGKNSSGGGHFGPIF